MREGKAFTIIDIGNASVNNITILTEGSETINGEPMPYKFNIFKNLDYYEKKESSTGGTPGIYEGTFWDDIRFPSIGRNLDVSSGRIDYDYEELGIAYASNSRYPQEVVGMVCQLHHSWKLGSNIHPHIHWVQNQNRYPNWLLEYRVTENGSLISNTWYPVIPSTHIFTYVSGDLLQISSFPEIDMSSVSSVSGIVDFKLYRDIDNISGLFPDTDSYVNEALLKEFDIHFEIDTAGSDTEFVK